jgi:predicted ATPase
MKTGILLAVLLAVAGIAVAEEVKQNTLNQQQLSKRPYAAPVVDKETFDGAVVDKEVAEQPKKLNVFMLDRRPFAVKAAD